MSLPSAAGGDCVVSGGGAAGGFWASELQANNRAATATPSLKLRAIDSDVHVTPRLPEEHRTEVGSVNLRVAHGARLILGGLIVRRALRLTRRAVHVRRMAAETQEVDVIHLQQARIGRSVGGVTGQAALVGLHRSMLKHERSHRVCVALGTDGELSRCSTNLMPGLRAVRIVTIAALYQPDLNPVAVGPVEFCFLRGMTPEAQILLRFHQHEIDVSGFVRAVAGSATEAVCHVFRFGEILCLQARLMTLGSDGGRLSRT